MINIRFDKRLELIYGLIFCVAKDAKTDIPFIAETNPEYDFKFYEMYKKGITKEFFDYINAGGLDSYNRCIDIANALDENYDINVDSNIKNIEQNNHNFNAAKLSEYLKEFIKKTNYNSFYMNQENNYNVYIENLKKVLSIYPDSVSTIESFYGYSQGSMEIILLNFSKGSYGQKFGDKIVYISRVDKEFSKYILDTLFHEFSHPYINPLGEKYFSNIELKNVYNYSKNHGLAGCYNTTIIMVNEYVVRAVQIILSSKYFDEERISKTIDRFRNIGYPHILKLIKVFDDKDNYNSFEDFYQSKIVKFFIELEEKCE